MGNKINFYFTSNTSDFIYIYIYIYIYTLVNLVFFSGLENTIVCISFQILIIMAQLNEHRAI